MDTLEYYQSVFFLDKFEKNLDTLYITVYAVYNMNRKHINLS